MADYNNSPGMSGLFRLAPIAIGFLIMGGIALRSCKEGPFGRSQLITVSYDQEYQLGRQAYQQILAKSKVIENDAVASEVRKVGERLRRAAEDPELRKQLHLDPNVKLQWEYNVIQDRQINAFCLPGGKVAVYTGIMPVAKTDAGLAVVLGHEIGHALARHGAERISQNQLVQIGQVAVASSLGNMSPQAQQTVMSLLGTGAQVGILLPFSRKQESEADKIGLMLMADAGYDPHEAIEFWKRMEAATGDHGGPEFLNTHPGHETRINDLARLADTDAMPLYRKSQKAPNHQLPQLGQRPERLPEPTASELKGRGYEFELKK